jgi:hypothetical protein
MKKITLLVLALASTTAYSFDLEDFGTTYKATRDAYTKAYNEKRLAESAIIAVMIAHKGSIPMPIAGMMKNGLDILPCAHLADCKAARAQSVVLPKVSSHIADANVRKLLGASEADQLRSDIETYYSKLDATINSNKSVLFEEITDFKGVDYANDLDLSNTSTERTTEVTDKGMEFRAARDAYLKARNELKLATSPYHAAKAAYAAAAKSYIDHFNCSEFGPGKSIETMIKDGQLGAD